MIFVLSHAFPIFHTPTLFAQSSKLNKGLSSEMKRVADERELLRQRTQRLEEEIESGKAMLSKLAASLWGDRVSKLIMRQLEPNTGGSDGERCHAESSPDKCGVMNVK